MDEKFVYGIGKNPETGFAEIRPMNEAKVITIHGAEEAIFLYIIFWIVSKKE